MQRSAVDLDGLRSFVEVAERLAFAEAAAALRISAPALTRRIQRLEAALGTVLLERSTRQVAPTAEGRLFLPLARDALAAVDGAVQALGAWTRARAGQLTLACVPTMTHQVLPGIIREHRTRWPETPLRVVECGAAAVVRAVRDGTAEFGFGFRVGAADEAELAFEPIAADPYCLVLPSGHPLATRDAVAWRELKPHKVITAGRGSGNMAVLDRALRGVDWRPETAYEVDHLTTSLGLVDAGLGIAVVPRSALPALMPATTATRPLTGPEVTRGLGVFRRRQPLSAAAGQFLAAVRRVAGGSRAASRPGRDGPAREASSTPCP